jgi:hypothetical protein
LNNINAATKLANEKDNDAQSLKQAPQGLVPKKKFQNTKHSLVISKASSQPPAQGASTTKAKPTGSPEKDSLDINLFPVEQTQENQAVASNTRKST